jgi:hypothetical protein
MVSFAYAPLLWGLLLVGAPVLIHLINMLRHRRVAWAAMEFLAASQKKNRTRVFFKQLLLLLLRMAVIAAVVLLAAKPCLRSQLGHWFAGNTTHHIVLLDDSYSMSDRWENTSALDQAKTVIQRIGDDVGREGSQVFTLVRFSQAGRAARGAQPDFLQDQVDREFPQRLRDKLAAIHASQTASEPAPAMEAVDQLLGASNGHNRVVYIVSDFRARQWTEPEAIRKHLRRWNDAEVKIHMIHCVDSARPNLAIMQLAPGPGTHAAGVQMFMEATVQNFSDRLVRDVPVLVEVDGQSQPALRIASIPPRRAVKERFPVRFATAGEHRVTVRLEPDAVAADNFRCAVVDVPLHLPVLLVDGDPEAKDAKYLSAVFAPGGPQATGIQPRIETARYLSANPLDSFRAIYLLNVERLEKSAVAALEQYCRAGGGVGFFVGDRSRTEFINRDLYRNGEGLFPAPVAGSAELMIDYLEKAPDLQVAPHPIFQVFVGERNSFLPLVNVARYMTTAKGWRPSAASGVEIIAKLRNGAPLVLERRFGQGKVVAFLTTASPTWNNWARENPSFVVAMLELQAYLASQPASAAPLLVGSPLQIRLDPARYDPLFRVTTPVEDLVPTASIEAAVGVDGKLGASFLNTDAAGYYQLRLTPKNGKEESRLYAYNVLGDEGDLRILDGQELASRLEGVQYAAHQAAAYQYASEEHAGRSLTETVLYLLVALLLGEQLLAWSASYHPPAAKSRAAAAVGGSR